MERRDIRTYSAHGYLALRLVNLLERINEVHRNTIQSLVDQLVAMEFTIHSGDKEVMMDLLSCIANQVDPDDVYLAAKCCQLMKKITKRCNVPDAILIKCIEWCLKALSGFCSLSVLDTLAALEALLRGNPHVIPLLEDPEELLGEDGTLNYFLKYGHFLEKQMEFTTVPEIQLMIVNCFKSILTPTAWIPDAWIVVKINSIITKLLYRIHEFHKDVYYCLVIQKSLQIVHCIIELNIGEVLINEIGEFIGITQCYSFFGLEQFGAEGPKKVYPTTVASVYLSSSACTLERGAKAIRLRKARFSKSLTTKAEDEYLSPSDNPRNFWQKTSDSNVAASELMLEQGKVRVSALMVLSIIVKETDHKIMFSYWRSLLPDGPRHPCSRNLLNALMYDPLHNARMEAVNVLLNMLCGTRNLLSYAENSDTPSPSFRPFSVILGDMVSELHSSLCSALVTECYTPVLVHLLRCCAKLIQCTTYHRLSPGLLSKLIQVISIFVSHKVWTVQVASLTALGSVVAISPRVEEVEEAVSKPATVICQQGVDALSGEECASDMARDQVPWVLDICFQNLITHDRKVKTKVPTLPPVTVRVESYQVLASLAKNYFMTVLQKHVGMCVNSILAGIEDPDVNVRLHAGKFMEAIGSAFMKLIDEEGRKDAQQQGLEFWKMMFQGPINTLLVNQAEPVLLAIGCQCLAAIGSSIFELLEHNEQQRIIQVLVDRAEDRDSSVKSSAMHALGTIIYFPSVQDNNTHIFSIIEKILCNIESSYLTVKFSASWSLGNVSDVLVYYVVERKQKLPHTYIQQLLCGTMKLVSDVDKVQVGSVRAIGNLLSLLNDEMMENSSIREAAKSAISLLVRLAIGGRGMKTRWNACYSLGTMMKNTAVYADPQLDCESTIFPALTDIVQNGTHFKVRISAATALSAPFTRYMYDKYYLDVWRSLIEGLENSQSLNFSEFGHQQQLRDEICSSICHLVGLLTKSDLEDLHEILITHMDNMAVYFQMFHEHIVPEKADILSAAIHHLCVLIEDPETIWVEGLSSSRLLLRLLITANDPN